MIKKTLCFSNPAYLSLRNAQLVIKLPEVEKADSLTEDFKKTTEVTRPVEDIGVVVLDHKQITITQGALEALLENNLHYVSVFHIRPPLCQYGKCRGSSKACKSHLA